jgi:hypothetical protein
VVAVSDPDATGDRGANTGTSVGADPAPDAGGSASADDADADADAGPGSGGDPTPERSVRPAAAGPDDGAPGDTGPPDDGGRPVRRYVDYAVLAGLLLVGAVAAISLYLSASQVITDWVAPAYRSLFRTAFNLVVLLVVGVGVSRQARRLR